MADEHELTRAFEEAARRRADLHHALVDVERAISSPAWPLKRVARACSSEA